MVAPRGWEEKGERDELEQPLSTELVFARTCDMLLCTGMTACIYNSKVHVCPDTGGKDFKCFHHKEMLEDRNVDPD